MKAWTKAGLVVETIREDLQLESVAVPLEATLEIEEVLDEINAYAT